jgi:hypothetical protein
VLHLFVCSDLVLLTKPSGSQFKVQDVLALSTINLFDMRADPKHPSYSFKVASPNNSYVVVPPRESLLMYCYPGIFLRRSHHLTSSIGSTAYCRGLLGC